MWPDRRRRPSGHGGVRERLDQHGDQAAEHGRAGERATHHLVVAQHVAPQVRDHRPPVGGASRRHGPAQIDRQCGGVEPGELGDDPGHRGGVEPDHLDVQPRRDEADVRRRIAEHDVAGPGAQLVAPAADLQLPGARVDDEQRLGRSEQGLDGGVVADVLDREPVRRDAVVLQVEAGEVGVPEVQGVRPVDRAQERVGLLRVGRREVPPARDGDRGGRPLRARVRGSGGRAPGGEFEGQVRPDRLAVREVQHAPATAQPRHRTQAGSGREGSRPPVAHRHAEPGAVEHEPQPRDGARVHDGVVHQFDDDIVHIVPAGEAPPVAGVAQELAGTRDRGRPGRQVEAPVEPGRAGVDEARRLLDALRVRHGVGHAARSKALDGGRAGSEEHQPRERPSARGRHRRHEHLGGRRPVEPEPGDVQQHRDTVGEHLGQRVDQVGRRRAHDGAPSRRHHQAGVAAGDAQLDTRWVGHRGFPSGLNVDVVRISTIAFVGNESLSSGRTLGPPRQ